MKKATHYNKKEREYLRLLEQEPELNQNQIAEKLGVSKQYVSLIKMQIENKRPIIDKYQNRYVERHNTDDFRVKEYRLKVSLNRALEKLHDLEQWEQELGISLLVLFEEDAKVVSYIKENAKSIKAFARQCEMERKE